MEENKVTPQSFASQMQQLGIGMEVQGEYEEKKDVTIVDFKMVSFTLAGKDYAIDIMNVKEIAKAGQFTYVPNALPFVIGVYNLRGEIIPIIDLRIFFNIDIPERKKDDIENVIFVTVGEQIFGVVVDVIDRVVGVQKSTIQPPHPLFGDISIKYIRGVVESEGHLYVLLDIDRIFGNKQKDDEEEDVASLMAKRLQKNAKISSQKQKLKGANVQAGQAKPVASNKDLSFIISGLSSMRKFFVSPVNEAWVRERFDSWENERGKDRTQLQDISDADSFLKPFYSPCTGEWWSKDYADALFKALPDNTAKQIIVWNPGCGKGFETYSLACVLKRRYPDAKIRIYAHEVDLLNISNAPLLTIPRDVANGWFAPYVTQKTNGECTFTQNIRDSIMFEYHDCQNTNALPAVDIVFARDVISFLDPKIQDAILNDFNERVKGNGIVFLGENEIINDRSSWTEKKEGKIRFFSK